MPVRDTRATRLPSTRRRSKRPVPVASREMPLEPLTPLLRSPETSWTRSRRMVTLRMTPRVATALMPARRASGPVLVSSRSRTTTFETSRSTIAAPPSPSMRPPLTTAGRRAVARPVTVTLPWQLASRTCAAGRTSTAGGHGGTST
jgi:hypothetical protein